MGRNAKRNVGSGLVVRTSVRCVIAALAFMSAGAQAAEWKVTPRLDLGETYTDNVTLAPSGSAKSDWITQVTPGVSIEGTGSRLRLRADYALQNLIYANESSRNNFFHQLNANANATLVENTLFLDARGNIQQQATSLLAPISNNNLNPGNVTDVSSYSVSPYLLHKFGSTAVGQLRFTHDATDTSASGLSDSSSNKINAQLNSGAAFYDLGWGLSYSDEKVDYGLLPDTETKVLTANLSYRILTKVQLLATLGHEKNNFAYTGGQAPSGNFWSAGFAWTPNVLNNVSASFGERYFGKTYTLQGNHIAPHSSLTIGYNQDVTSLHQEMQNPLLGPIFDYYQRLLSAMRPELSTQEVRDTITSEFAGLLNTTPEQLTNQLQILTNQIYLSKQFIVSGTLKSGKSNFTISASRSERKSVSTTTFANGDPVFPQDGSTVKQDNLGGQWDIRVSPRNTANVGLNFSRYAFPTLSRTDNYRSIRLGMTRKLEKKVTGSVDFHHSLRDSNVNENDYTQNSISGHLMWIF